MPEPLFHHVETEGFKYEVPHLPHYLPAFGCPQVESLRSFSELL
jgi:hypothetical protein